MPLLQHQAQFGLNPALMTSARSMRPAVVTILMNDLLRVFRYRGWVVRPWFVSQPPGAILMQNFLCAGYEASIFDCPRATTRTTCDRSHHVFLQCGESHVQIGNYSESLLSYDQL